MASRDGVTEFPKEEIPDDATLYLRVHRNHQENGQLNPGAFKDHGGGMSACWSKYASPEETRQRAKHPEDNGVVEMVAAEVRRISGLRIEHTPMPDNRAHIEIIGNKKDPEVRLLLLRACRWAIDVPSPLG